MQLAMALGLVGVGFNLRADVNNLRLAAQPMAIELGKIMFADTLNSLAPVPNQREVQF